MHRKIGLTAIMAWIWVALPLWAWEISHHELQVELEPQRQELTVTDTMTCVPDGKPELLFCLRGSLKLELVSAGWSMEKLGKATGTSTGINSYFPNFAELLTMEGYRLTPATLPKENKAQVMVRYAGKIAELPQMQAEEYARGFAETPGIVCAQGVYLAGASFWYPRQEGKLVTFRLTVNLPQEWRVVSQGNLASEQVANDRRVTVWDAAQPADEIYLAGGPLFCYEGTSETVRTFVYLRTPDYRLARPYLAYTGQYLTMYSALLGNYLYDKFGLVENFWETGYGMPSFTLLGSKVIRLPFILKSSYPHEILHNWWGNGVWVDYASGNWCEGLTAYLADHLFKEIEGDGAGYRHQVLQKYRNFVHDQDDFPLSQFQSRHSQATEAVGYGKSLMLFHELRQRLGDELFVAGLREFYRRFQLKKAGFRELSEVFSEVGKQDLRGFFDERVSRRGAPELRLSQVMKRWADEKVVVQFTLEQVITEAQPHTYDLQVPVVFTLANGAEAWRMVMPLTHASQSATIALSGEPARLDIDPEFDLFRKLDASEIPASVGQLMGSQSLMLVYSGATEIDWGDACRKLAAAWSIGRKQPIQVVEALQLEKLPENTAIWFVGQCPPFGAQLKKWFGLHQVTWQAKTVTIAGTEVALGNRWLVLTAGHPRNPELAIGWLYGGPAKGFESVVRKLPHYGKYSYLAFDGDEASNVAKGQWPIANSVLTYSFSEATQPCGKLPIRKPLATLPPAVRCAELERHVRYLAAPELQGRGLGSEGLATAASYIATEMAKARLLPGGEQSTFRQSWQVNVPQIANPVTLSNLIAILPGQEAQFNDSPVVVTAHYDHLGFGWPDVKAGNAGKIHYGADDNASGVAALLEIARALSQVGLLKRPVWFVAFSGEEAGCLGSRYFVSRLSPEQQKQVVAVVNLDTIGRLTNRRLLAFGSQSARQWPDLLRVCAENARLDIVLTPGNLNTSDHVSFIEKGIPAIHLATDIHSDYHTPGDTVDKLSWPGLVAVSELVSDLVQELAGRERPLTPATMAVVAPQKPATGKRASLGTIPDFTFQGKGVGVTGVTPGSPAAQAGIVTGDVVVGIGEFTIENLADLARALQYYLPGTKVEIRYQRGKNSYAKEVVLVEK